MRNYLGFGSTGCDNDPDLEDWNDDAQATTLESSSESSLNEAAFPKVPEV